jgi:tungstate transport system ATP-binding protein
MAASILPLELKDVNFVARGMRLIKDMNLALIAGPRTAVIGPNGAGKSLLLRLCHGLLQPSSGRISWQTTSGQDAADHQAMVFQRPVMLRRSAAANIDYALGLKGIHGSERRERIDAALARAGLRRLADQPARLMSFGEQQRLALARAWALQPQVLFLDEATASLDPAATHAVEEMIHAIHAEGTRIVMTTHDLGQAKRLSDEVIFMHRGRMLERAPTAKFFDAPENDLAQAFVKGELLWWNKRELDDKPHHMPKYRR